MHDLGNVPQAWDCIAKGLHFHTIRVWAGKVPKITPRRSQPPDLRFLEHGRPDLGIRISVQNGVVLGYFLNLVCSWSMCLKVGVVFTSVSYTHLRAHET